MAGKTKRKQTLSFKKNARQKEKKQIWLDSVEEYYEKYYDYCDDWYDDYGENYFNYIEQTNYYHDWIEKKEDFCEPIFACSLCGLVAVGKPKDDYLPPVYEYYVKYKEDADMSCAEHCMKAII